jgi:chemotaxis response regulator CheB
LKALIVDDSSFAQRMLKAFLEKSYPEIEIVLAGNGRSGYAAFMRENPDVIFTDSAMYSVKASGKNGYQLYAAT